MNYKMIFTSHLSFFLLWMFQDFLSLVNAEMPIDHLTVALGDTLTLNCTYNCSTGFVRGCWSKGQDVSVCHGTIIKGNFCTVSLHLSNVSAKDLKKSYSCYTQDTEHPQLQQDTKRLVYLNHQAQTSTKTWTLTPESESKNGSVSAKPKDLTGGEFNGIKVVATVTVAVALVLGALALYLCLNRNKLSWNGKGEPSLSITSSVLHSQALFHPVNGSLSSQNERVALRIPSPNSESDNEVPYADIMITVRGVSTPELSKVTPGDQKEWREDDSRSHLQASRSADRLYVPQPREVSRKMSTSSEYAVITYA